MSDPKYVTVVFEFTDRDAFAHELEEFGAMFGEDRDPDTTARVTAMSAGDEISRCEKLEEQLEETWHAREE